MRIVKELVTTTVLIAASAPSATTAPETLANLEQLVAGILELTDAAAAIAVNNTVDHEFRAGDGGNGGSGGSNVGQVYSTTLGQPLEQPLQQPLQQPQPLPLDQHLQPLNFKQNDNANGGSGGRGGDVNVIICVSCNNFACPQATATTPSIPQITTSCEVHPPCK